jgi:hypothetical protein
LQTDGQEQFLRVLFVMDLSQLSDPQKAQLIESRWNASDSLWKIVKDSYDANLKVYQNKPDWVENSIISRKRTKVRANRIFRDMESVINALIANPPQPNLIPNRDTPEAKELAQLQEKYFLKRYIDLNIKETFRKGLRNLYFARLIVLKPFWNPKINDFDVRAIDPRKVRFSPNSTKEEDSEIAIEEVEDTISSVIARFPAKKDQILKEAGYLTEQQAYIENPKIKYKEAWIGSYCVFKYNNTILATIKNPYWDWDGLLVTAEEEQELKALGGEQRRNKLSQIRQEQAARRLPAEGEKLGQELPDLHAYYFNHFDFPRKPYIFATLFNNENTPIGQTDMIAQATPLQENIDRRKQDIDENASLVNGQIKVDAASMSKADAQKLRFEARGVIWAKNVKDGVTRETGTPLPEFVYQDMVDSRAEIDNIMAASSAFRGEREGQETKAGRLALIDQSYLNLNELVQVVDYCSNELFNWFYQLAKVRYTEHHYAKHMGRDNSLKVFSLIQDDFEDGAEIKVIGGKTLPEDRQFKFEQAQADVQKGVLSPIDYFEVAGYDQPLEKAQNLVKYQLNPPLAVGIPPEELAQLAPAAPEEDKPSRSISFKDLPPDGQIQLAEQAGIQLDPLILVKEKLKKERQEQEDKQFDREQAMAKANAKPEPAKKK